MGDRKCCPRVSFSWDPIVPPARKGADLSGFRERPSKADGLRRQTRWRVSWFLSRFFPGKGGVCVLSGLSLSLMDQSFSARDFRRVKQ